MRSQSLAVWRERPHAARVGTVYPTGGFVTTRMTVAMAQTRRVSVLAHVGQWLMDRSVLACVTKTCP